MNKNDPNLTQFDKYDVDANIEEIENNDIHSIFKYEFMALSNPKNVKLSLEGIAKIEGDSIERDDIITKDENDIPKILTLIYHELFPTFFILSKSLNVSCPPHMIGTINNSINVEPEDDDEDDLSPQQAPPQQAPPQQAPPQQAPPQS